MTTEQHIERIYKQLRLIAGKQEEKETWVSTELLQKLTVLDVDMLKSLRRDKQIEYKGVGKGTKYLLSSVNKIFFKHLPA